MAEDVGRFARMLAEYREQIDGPEHEIHFRAPLKQFLHALYNRRDYYINTKLHQDLAIFLGPNNQSPVGVIFETKPPGSAEMVRKDKINVKAVWELIYYYFEECVEKRNFQIKHLVATDFLDFFIFDANEFDRYFFKNKTIKKLYETTVNDNKGKNWFYPKIAELLDQFDDELSCVQFTLAEPDKLSKTALTSIYNVFSPQFLIKKRPAADSNALNRPFYDELLHIIGLGERKDGKKVVIDRLDETNRNGGSLLELTISKLTTMFNSYHSREVINTYGKKDAERIYNIAFELCLTWVNRILFLKLLESQLAHFHPGKKEYRFLNSDRVPDFNQLWNLFHEVLAKPAAFRGERYAKRFELVPYLNSSLFEPTDLESITTRITELDDDVHLPFAARTVLRDRARDNEKLGTLAYLFAFLDSYDYTSVTRDQLEIADDRLLNASILGKIFEKINGYRDGSIYTPGFITMYMCREALRPAVVRRFNESEGWDLESFTGLHNRLGHYHEPADILRFNDVVDSLRVCDPAVGSGHFLVSALNELIVIKHELGILADEAGRTLSDIHITVIDDELRITRKDGDPFKYEIVKGRPDPETQRIQRTLFHEKEKLIENCLFGVDVNGNSVKICQLRLWIELLKHAYYKPDSEFRELETLPNIDINIKQGNSLVSRFALQEAFTTPEARRWREEYGADVQRYKETRDKTVKDRLREHIEEIKKKFASQLPDEADGLRKRLYKQDVIIRDNRFMDSVLAIRSPEEREKRIARAEAEKERIQKKIDAIDRKYDGAFEWRFGFPEVLDDEGNFAGFDAVIGNPPYIRGETIGPFKKHLEEHYEVHAPVADILVYFYEVGLRVLRSGGPLAYITSNKFIKAGYGEPVRAFLRKFQIDEMIDFGELPVFENSSTFPIIIRLRKSRRIDESRFTQIKSLRFESLADVISSDSFVLTPSAFTGSTWTLAKSNVIKLIRKIEVDTIPLSRFARSDPERGIITGLTEAFVIDKVIRRQLIDANPEADEIIVPFAVGDDIRKYHVKRKDTYLILTKIGTNMERYPAVMEHLSQFEEKLRKRLDQGNHWWELRACSYYADFENPRIIYPDIAKSSRMAFVEEPLYVANTAYIIPTTDKFLVGLLNSKLIYFYYSQIAAVLGDAQEGGRLRWFTQYVSGLPIRNPDAAARERCEQLVEQIIDKKADSRETIELEEQIDDLVFDLYGISADERKIIENYFAS